MKVKIILMLMALILAGSQPALGLPVAPIDDKHGLDNSGKIEQYKNNGEVKVNLNAPDISLKICKEKDDCDISGWTPSDSLNDFLVLKYNEEIDRRLRIYIPQEYLGLHRGTFESIDGNKKISVDVAESGEYSIIKIDVKGPIKSKFAFNEISDGFNSQVGDRADFFDWNDTASSEWKILNNISYNKTYTIKGKNVIVEYRDGQDWITAGTSSDTSKPIYKQQIGKKIINIHTTVKNPPQVRFKKNADISTQLTRSLNEALSAPGRFAELIGRLIGF